MPFQFLHGIENWKKQELEPTSVLHMRRSPSPPTSASTPSSSFGGAAVADPRKDEWASELPPIPTGLVTGRGDDWESLLSDSANPDQSLLRWISDDSSFDLKQLLHNDSPDFNGNAGQIHEFDQMGFSSTANLAFSGFGGKICPVSSGLPHFKASGFYKTSDVSNPNFVYPGNNFPPVSQIQNPNFFMPSPVTFQQEQLFQPQPKRRLTGALDPKPPFSDEFSLRQHQNRNQHQSFPPASGFHFPPQPEPVMQKLTAPGEEMARRQEHALLDQIYTAAELVGSGNFTNAQAILARLNQQLSPAGKPLHRAAFYFKEALQLNNPPTPPRPPSPSDVIFKIGAYKVFSDVSPITQFVNFTCNQAFLEALSGSDRIHIFDFDIGFGAQWASFMQELPVMNREALSLKITAFASLSTHHPVELELMRQNLAQFASDIGLNFELEFVNIDSLDQSSFSLPVFVTSGNEAVAVNFPIWSSANQPSALPALLRLVKQLNPKIVVSMDRGCDRSDLPFPQHVLQALQSCIHLLESLDAGNATLDAVSKIERFLLHPGIERIVSGRLRCPETMPVGKTQFASGGFSPLLFSNFTETQAECVVRRTPVRGFRVEKRQASLVLCWQGREVISASAWRC